MIRQRVNDCVVARCWIQPVWLFGLPGRSTSSQRRPWGPVARATTGRTVRSPVIGRASLSSVTRRAVRAWRHEDAGVVVERRELLLGLPAERWRRVASRLP